MRYQSICFTAPEQTELIESEIAPSLNPDEVAGSTLYSLISPGTELTGIYGEDIFRPNPATRPFFELNQLAKPSEISEKANSAFAWASTGRTSGFGPLIRSPCPMA